MNLIMNFENRHSATIATDFWFIQSHIASSSFTFYLAKISRSELFTIEFYQRLLRISSQRVQMFLSTTSSINAVQRLSDITSQVNRRIFTTWKIRRLSNSRINENVDLFRKDETSVTMMPWIRIIETSISILSHLSYSGIFRSDRQVYSL